MIHASEVNQKKHCLVDMCAMIAVPKLLGLIKDEVSPHLWVGVKNHPVSQEMCNFVAEANPCSCNESWGPWFMATTNALFVQNQEKFQLLFLEQDTCWWLRNTTKWSNSRCLMFAWAIWAFKKSHWQPTFAPQSKTWFMTALKLMLPWAKVELVLKASELIQQKIYFCMWRGCNQKTWLLCWRISESQTQYPPPFNLQ